RLHRICASVVADQVKWRARDLQSVSDPRALISNLPSLIVEPRTVLHLPGGLLSARVSQGFGDLVSEPDRDAIAVTGRRRIHEVLAATSPCVQHVGHVGERYARGHTGI